MDLPSLSVGLDQVAPSGAGLSTERRVALQTSLLLLKSAEKFARVTYWGKICGVSADYFVAQGYNDLSDPFTCKNFYSMDCIKWAQLPPIHPVLQKSCSLVRGRFTGSPSYETTVQETGPSTEEERPELPEEVATLRVEETKGDGSMVVTTRIREEVRLAAVVQIIDSDTKIVPRGVYRKTPANTIEANRTFGGLQAQDAGKLQNYLHCRPAITLAKKTTLEMAKLDPSLDFLDALTDDIPRGSWCIQHQHGSQSVVVKSVAWTGFVFFHMPGTSYYGHVYVGNGLKNNDLIFMLP